MKKITFSSAKPIHVYLSNREFCHSNKNKEKMKKINVSSKAVKNGLRGGSPSHRRGKNLSRWIQPQLWWKYTLPRRQWWYLP